jgi:hypothetical protein
MTLDTSQNKHVVAVNVKITEVIAKNYDRRANSKCSNTRIGLDCNNNKICKECGLNESSTETYFSVSACHGFNIIV